jgi:hypothetical protein
VVRYDKLAVKSGVHAAGKLGICAATGCFQAQV